MKHKPIVTANATAVTVAFISLFCTLSVILFPDLTMSIAKSWFHGIDISKITASNITLDSFIMGFITSTAGGWIVGFVFAQAYNFFAKK